METFHVCSGVGNLQRLQLNSKIGNSSSSSSSTSIYIKVSRISGGPGRSVRGQVHPFDLSSRCLRSLPASRWHPLVLPATRFRLAELDEAHKTGQRSLP